MNDPLLEMIVAVEHCFEASASEVWSLLTDLPRMAALSPEVAEVSWADSTTFTAVNRRGGMQWSVTGHVLESVAPKTFVWCISEPGHRSSTWRYDLESEGSGTRVRQTFRHGPGMSMVRRAIEDGANADETIAWRSQMLAADMSDVLAAADGLLRSRSETTESATRPSPPES